MSWNEVGSDAVETKKVKFLKLPAGITNLRILDQVPYSRWQHWIPQAKRSVTCPGKGCPVCALNNIAKANGEDAPYNNRKTHSMNVLNRTTGEVELMEQGNNFFEELRIILDDNGDVRDYDIKVRRTGMDKSTKYRIDALAKAPITDEEAALELTNIDEYFGHPTCEQVTRLLNGEDAKEVFKSETIELA